MQETAAAPEPAVRLDPVPLDPSWPAPPAPEALAAVPAAEPDPPPAPRRRRRRLAGVVSVLVLALLATGLWVGGAFDQRTDRRRSVAAGSTITTGPFELTFTRATVQRRKNYDDTIVWRVSAIGSGRTTGDESIAPNMDKSSGMMAVRAESTDLFGPALTMNIGAADGSISFTPGIRPVPISVDFELTDSWTFEPRVLLVVFDQELRDNSLLKDQTPSWRNGTYFFVYPLPVTRLPDDLD